MALAFSLVPVATHAQDPPALVVLMTVDQLRPDYPDRFASDLTGGFARLAREGAFFTRGMQDHAITSTAPGHATLWSGRFPANTGIISNDLGVPDPSHPLVDGADGPGAFPRRFRGTALYDWLRAADEETRMFSVSRKDRGAILPVGTARVPTFWWSADGRFTTSTYYSDTLPTWVTRWNDRLRRAQWSGRTWSLALPEQAYPEPDDRSYEGMGAGRGNTFPHRMGSIRDLDDFPWMDSLTLELALTGMRELQLGRRGATDLMAVSLSTLDAIGHHFGPDSRELHDHFVRLDRWLGTFMSTLEAELAGRAVLFVVSSDHGVESMPEHLRALGFGRGGRIDLAAPLARIIAPLQRRHQHDFGVLMQDGLVLADTVTLAARGMEVAELGRRVAAAFSEQEGVARTFTPETLDAAPLANEAANRWRRTIPPEYGWIALAEPEPGWVFGRATVAQHGTPLPDNIMVPVFFLGPGIPERRVERPIRTVDVAPTVAALLGLCPTEVVDGHPLGEIVGDSIRPSLE